MVLYLILRNCIIKYLFLTTLQMFDYDVLICCLMQYINVSVKNIRQLSVWI